MNTDRTWIQIDLDNIEHNLREIRKLIPCTTRIMGVVKADGYGHGSIEVSRILEKNSTEYLAVATAEEAFELRENKIKLPILCLGFTDEKRYPQIVDLEITQTIYSYLSACILSKIAIAAGKTAKVHIKIDTGMNRIGFPADDESLAQIVDMAELKGIFIEGIFSHLSCSENEDDSYSNMQFDSFRDFCSKLAQKGIRPHIKHISNSGAIIRLPYMSMDMVRAGIMLYGYYPDEALKKNGIMLKPSLSLKSRIIHIKDIPVGASVSYGRRFITEKKSTIATVPVGYADGYPRLLSCKARVIIRGEFAPVVGTVCMDQMMIDITECKEKIKTGDEVVLIGTQGSKTISVEDIAKLTDTINYEIVCRMGKRVPRIYRKSF